MNTSWSPQFKHRSISGTLAEFCWDSLYFAETLQMRFLCSAAFVLVSSIQANAMCVAGIGDSCPPSDAVIQQQIREQIDGKFLHNQRITTEIYKFNIPHGTIAPQAVDQMRSEIGNGLIPFTLSGQSCDGIAGFMPSVMKGQNYNVSSFANPCKNARRLSSAG